MASLAKMKADLAELEGEKKKLRTDINASNKSFGQGVYAIGGGILLVVFGFLMIYALNSIAVGCMVLGGLVSLGGAIYAFIVNERRTRQQDRLNELETKIISLQNAMG